MSHWIEKLKSNPPIVEYHPIEIVLGKPATAVSDAEAEAEAEAVELPKKIKIIDKRKEYSAANFFRKLDLQDPILPPAPVPVRPEQEITVPVVAPRLRKIGKKIKLKEAEAEVEGKTKAEGKADAEADAEAEEGVVFSPVPIRERKKRIKKGVIELGEVGDLVLGDTLVSKRIPIAPITKLRVSNYFLNNREFFVPFIQKYLKSYKEDLLTAGVKLTCEDLKRNQEEVADVESTILVNQKIVRDYLSSRTPYRGLLLMHGLGSGKTRSAIVISEGFLQQQTIMVMLPASLRRNFVEEIKKYGNVLFRKNNYWEFLSLPHKEEGAAKRDNFARQLSGVLKLTVEDIERQGGAWLVNASKPPNYGDLSTADKQKLNTQLDKMIEYKYKFINYNGLRKAKFAQLTDNLKKNIFDNTVVIIDEAHNFISRIVNKLNKIKKTQNLHTTRNLASLPLFLQMYEMLMDAQNARIVFLTGTPIINYPNEIAILFNILRGYIRTFSFPITATQAVSSSLFQKLLPDRVDSIQYTGSTKTLSLTRNPLGFVSAFAASASPKYEGVAKQRIYQPESDADFIRQIQTVLAQSGVTAGKPSIQVYTALPDRLETFLEMFFNKDTGQIINIEKFKRRIIGLTSYFKSAQEELLPKYDKVFDFHVVSLPMSDYQFKIYEKARQEERKREKMSKQKQAPKVDANGLYQEPTSTYRIFSRLYCNFVMPRPPGRPVPPRMAPKTEAASEGGPSAAPVLPSAAPVGAMHKTKKVKICPPEKELNPNTGNCVLKCKPGQVRNEQFKCVQTRKRAAVAPPPTLEKIAKEIPPPPPRPLPPAAAKTEDCPPEKERNPLTGRCVLKCKPGQIRNEQFKCVAEKKKGGAPDDADDEAEDEAEADLVPEEDRIEDEEEEEKLAGEDGEIEGDIQLELTGGVTYLEEIQRALGFLKTHQATVLSPEGLATYSPKMLAVLENIEDEAHIGGHLVYSQFRTMEGLGIFTMVLDANGFTRFRIKREPGGWKVDISEANQGKRTYALYTGTEEAEEREIIRNIYNGAWNDVPSGIATWLRKRAQHNQRGEIIKVFMITAAGSEGISLKNTRYVHCMEPYWNPVRLEQVIGRAKRICSHEELPIELQTIEVFLYLMKFSKEQLASEDAIELKIHDNIKRAPIRPITTDEALWEISNIKEEISGKLLTAVKETSIDCSIHTKSNQKENLSCLSFGPNPDVMDFAYQPDITQDQNDKMKQINQRMITWRAREILINEKKMILREDTQEIYDLAAYQQMTQNPNYHAVPLGRLVQEEGRVKVIRN